MNFHNNSRFWIRAISYVLVAVVSAAIAFVLGTSTRPEINYSSNGTIISSNDKLDQIQKIIKENYIGDADADALVEAAAAAMVEATGDKWSFYMTAKEYKLYQEESKNAYEGIGVTVKENQEQGGFVIEKVDSNSGAENAGLQAGDIITHVEGESIANMGITKVKSLIRGKKGTSVELTVLRDDQAQTVLVTRGSIAIEVAKSQLLDNGIGLITIANFDDRCAKETVEAIEEMTKQGARALIFDVRNNPGGYKHELVDLLDYLLPEGVLFSSETYDGEKSQDVSDSKCLEIPMAVLINKDSYSAAEFFAAALEEYDWAVTVGEHTTGKGYFQTNISLDDGSAVHLSVGKYFTPNGVSLAEVEGIAPAIEVKLEDEQTKQLAAGNLKPEDDPQVQAAVTELLQKLK